MDLFPIVSSGSLWKLKQQINLGADLHARNRYGQTLLHEATRGGHVEVFEYLTQLDLDPHDVSNDGETVLHGACRSGQYQMARYLCMKYPEMMYRRDKYDLSTMGYCAQGGNLDIFKFLFEQYLPIYKLNKRGWNVLHIACVNGRYELVKHLVSTCPKLKNETDCENLTALHCCAQSGNVEIFKMLVEEGLYVNSTTSDWRSVLHIACENARFDLTKHIVTDYPQLINKRDMDYASALHYSAQGGDVKIFRMLVNQGLDPYSVTRFCATVLHLACYSGRQELVKYLLSAYPDLKNKVDNMKRTVLHTCALGGNVELFKDFIDHGVDVHSTTTNGENVIHLACCSGNFELVDYILTNYPGLTLERTRDGMTPLDLACGNDHQRIISCLKVHLAKQQINPIVERDLGGESDMEELMSSTTEEEFQILNEYKCQTCQKKTPEVISSPSWYCTECRYLLCADCKEVHELNTPKHVIISLHPLCQICDENEVADWFCTQCGEFLCEDCKAHHRKMKRSKYHRLITSVDQITVDRVCVGKSARSSVFSLHVVALFAIWLLAILLFYYMCKMSGGYLWFEGTDSQRPLIEYGLIIKEFFQKSLIEYLSNIQEFLRRPLTEHFMIIKELLQKFTEQLFVDTQETDD